MKEFSAQSKFMLWVARLRAVRAHAHVPNLCGHCYISVISCFLPATRVYSLFTRRQYLQHLALVQSQGIVNETVIFWLYECKKVVVCRKQQTVKSHCKYLWLSAFHLDKFRTAYRCSSTQRVSFYVSMPFLTVAAGGFLLLQLFALFDIMSRSDSSVCLIYHCDDRTHMFVREHRQKHEV